MPEKYDFTTDWFSPHWPNWLAVSQGRTIAKALEIGSFEGRSACAMIEEFGRAGPLELHCIDTWGGSVEHTPFDMRRVEQRFDRNIRRAIAEAPNEVTVHKHKGASVEHLSAMLAGGHGRSFDLVFVDGSHVACDVLSDLVLGYHLCATGGLIICDDYLWSDQPHGREDPLSMPRAAINAFTEIFARKVVQLGGLPLYQVYLRKTA